MQISMSIAKIIARKELQFENRFLNSAINYLKENLGILLGLLAMSTVLSFMTPAFLTTDNVLLMRS